jgi:hypothetical protein
MCFRAFLMTSGWGVRQHWIWWWCLLPWPREGPVGRLSPQNLSHSVGSSQVWSQQSCQGWYTKSYFV